MADLPAAAATPTPILIQPADIRPPHESIGDNWSPIVSSVGALLVMGQGDWPAALIVGNPVTILAVPLVIVRVRSGQTAGAGNLEGGTGGRRHRITGFCVDARIIWWRRIGRRRARAVSDLLLRRR